MNRSIRSLAPLAALVILEACAHTGAKRIPANDSPDMMKHTASFALLVDDQIDRVVPVYRGTPNSKVARVRIVNPGGVTCLNEMPTDLSPPFSASNEFVFDTFGASAETNIYCFAWLGKRQDISVEYFVPRASVTFSDADIADYNQIQTAIQQVRDQTYSPETLEILESTGIAQNHVIQVSPPTPPSRRHSTHTTQAIETQPLTINAGDLLTFQSTESSAHPSVICSIQEEDAAEDEAPQVLYRGGEPSVSYTQKQGTVDCASSQGEFAVRVLIVDQHQALEQLAHFAKSREEARAGFERKQDERAATLTQQGIDELLRENTSLVNRLKHLEGRRKADREKAEKERVLTSQHFLEELKLQYKRGPHYFSIVPTQSTIHGQNQSTENTELWIQNSRTDFIPLSPGGQMISIRENIFAPITEIRTRAPWNKDNKASHYMVCAKDTANAVAKMNTLKKGAGKAEIESQLGSYSSKDPEGCLSWWEKTFGEDRQILNITFRRQDRFRFCYVNGAPHRIEALYVAPNRGLIVRSIDTHSQHAFFETKAKAHADGCFESNTLFPVRFP